MSNINTSVTPNTLLEGLREVFTDSYKLEKEPLQAVSTDIFNFYGSKKNSEDFQKVSGVGEFGAVAEEDPTPIVKRDEIHKTSFSHSTFRKGVGISYEALEDQLYNEMKDHVQQLGIAARFTQEKNRFAVIRNITTTLGSDGKALAATDHPLKDGSTQSNLVTGAVTLDKLKEMVQKLREQKDWNSKLIGGTPRKFLTAPANHAEILELTKSKLKAGTANNDLNYFSEVFPGLRVAFSPMVGTAVTGGSDTGVTLIGSRNKLITVIREKLKTWMNPWNESSDIVTKFNALYRESVGFADYIGVVHCTGA